MSGGDGDPQAHNRRRPKVCVVSDVLLYREGLSAHLQKTYQLEFIGAGPPTEATLITLERLLPEALILVSERRVKAERRRSDLLPPGTIFLVRKSSIDWTHTGLVVDADRDVFSSIEGKMNDEGSREGYEVCARTRSYAKKDFIVY